MDPSHSTASTSSISTFGSSSSLQQLSSSTRKRHHSPSPPRDHPSLSTTDGLARHDSHGQSESSLVEQIVTMRFHSAAAATASSVELENGQLIDDHVGLGSMTAAFPTSKTAPEQKEEDGGGVMQRYILHGLDVLKGGLKSEKREDADVMEDISKMVREEMDDDGPSHLHPHAPPRCHDDDEDELDALDDSATDHDAASLGDDDCRAWKRARHELHGTSPSSPSSPPSDDGEGGGGGCGLATRWGVTLMSPLLSSPHAQHDEGGDGPRVRLVLGGQAAPVGVSLRRPIGRQGGRGGEVEQQKTVGSVVEHSTLLSV